jgi:putative transposase
MLTVVDADGMTPNGSLIDEIVREGARRMLAAALEAEVNTYLAQLADQRDESGRRLVCATATTPSTPLRRRPARCR